jgi:hypothetical protein
MLKNQKRKEKEMRDVKKTLLSVKEAPNGQK